MLLVDIHAHLDFPEYSKDLGEVLGRAKSAGVVAVIAQGVHDRSNRQVLKLAEKHPLVKAALGIYPLNAKNVSVLDESVIRDSREIPSATAYDRRMGERVLTFVHEERGIVDRETGTRWNLFGTGTEGPLRGRQLEPVGAGVHFAFAWLAFNPDSDIYAP